MTRVRSIATFALRALIFLPLEAFLVVVAVFEFVDWLGLHKMPSVLKEETLWKPLGFIDGVTPFASWHNLLPLSIMAVFSGCLIQPIVQRSFHLQRDAPAGPSRNAIRKRLGRTLSGIADVAKLYLFFVAVFVLSSHGPALPIMVKWTALAASGTTMLIDGYSWSRNRYQYGLSNPFTVAEPHVLRLITRLTGNSRFAAAYQKVVADEETELDSKTLNG